MENRTRVEIGERTHGVVDTAEKQRWVDAIDKHLIDGTTEYVGLYTVEAHEAFVQLMGHEKITSDKIIAYTYEATANEVLVKSGEKINFKGRLPIHEIQNSIGDFGVNLEFANCFKTSLVIALDTESMVIYDFEVISQGVVCEACSTSDDPEIVEELALNEDSGYGCGHEDDDYVFKYGACLTERSSADAFLKNNDTWAWR